MFVPPLKSEFKKWTTSIEYYSKKSYPDWIIKNPEKKPTNPTKNPDTSIEVNKNIFFSVPYDLASVKNSEEFSDMPVYQVIFKGSNTLKSILMHPKVKIQSHLNHNMVLSR